MFKSMILVLNPKLDVLTVFVYNLQWIYGFLVFFYPRGTLGLRSSSLPWHVLFGILVYVLVVGNTTLGFLEKLTFLEHRGLAKYGAEALLVNFTAIVTILYGAFIVMIAISQPPQEVDDYDYGYGYSSI